MHQRENRTVVVNDEDDWLFTHCARTAWTLQFTLFGTRHAAPGTKLTDDMTVRHDRKVMSSELAHGGHGAARPRRARNPR